MPRTAPENDPREGAEPYLDNIETATVIGPDRITTITVILGLKTAPVYAMMTLPHTTTTERGPYPYERL